MNVESTGCDDKSYSIPFYENDQSIKAVEFIGKSPEKTLSFGIFVA